MLGLAWKYRLRCLRVLAQQLLLVVLGLAILQLTGLGIDLVRHAVDPSAPMPRWPWGLEPPADWTPRSRIVLIAGSVLGLALLTAAARYRAAVLAADLSQRIVIELRDGVYARLQQLSFRFYDRHASGSIINRVTGDVQAVRMFVDAVLLQFVVTAVSLGVYLVYMLRLHVPLTLASLATTPLLWWLARRCSRRLQPLFRRNRELADDMVLVLTENLQGIQVVKGFGREPEQLARFAASTARIHDGKREVFWTLSVFQPVVGGLTQLNLLVLLGFGGYLALEGELALGEGLFVFAQLLQQFATQIGSLANIGNTIQASITGAERVFEVLDAPAEVASPAEPVRLPRAEGRIAFEAVRFSYDGQHQALDGVSFEVRPGECVAIVGATGAGKTTLLSLVARFYDATGGRVLIDGHDVRDLDLADLRRNVAVVFQESFLFSHTVAANVAFGRPQAPADAVAAAARTAAADEFIDELAHGYDTVVGEYGANLSGGQRQRLALARAVLLDAPILLLDDATTAIDPETEHDILQAMQQAMRGRTTLVVAHRLSTLKRTDRVLVLAEGRLVQQGTHAELLRQPGHYRDNALAQLLDDETEQTATHDAAPPTTAREDRG